MISYKFSNLLGIVHNTGRVKFLKDNTDVLLSPIGNKILCLDLKYGTSQTLPVEARSNIDFIDITSDSKILIAVDIQGYCLVINFPKQIVISHFNFRSKLSALKISPNDKFLAIGIKKGVQIYEMPNIIKEFEPFVLYRKYTTFHNDKISVINWSSDSRFILTGSKDTTIRLLNVLKLKNFYPLCFTGHKKKIIQVLFSFDMNRIYSISQDGVLFIWKYTSEKSEEYKKRIDFIKNVKSQKNTKNHEKMEIENENDNIDDNESDSDTDPKYNTEFENRMLNGRFILEKKQHFNINSKVVICECTQISQEHNILVLGLQNGSFSIYDMQTLENKYNLKISEAKISSISINPNGTWIAFGSKYLNQLLVWEWKSETYVFKQQGHLNDIQVVAYSPEGSQIASGAEDGRIKIFDTSSSSCLYTFLEHKAKVTGLQFAPNKSSVLISSSYDGTVRAYDLIKYKNFRIMTTPEETQLLCCSINFSGEIVVAGDIDHYSVYVWNLKTGDLIDVLTGHTAPVSCLAFSRLTDLLVTGSWDNTVKFWELYTKKGISETYEHPSKIIALALSPNDKEIAVSTLNGELYTWDINTGAVKNIINVSKDIWGGRLMEDKITAKNNQRNKYLNTIIYNLPGNLLLCGGNSQYVLLYDMVYQILIKKFALTHNRSLNGILYKLNSKFDNDKSVLQTTNNGLDSEDEIEYLKLEKQKMPGNNIYTNDSSNTNLMSNMPMIKINSVQFSNTNRSFAVGTTEGIFIYSLDKSFSFSKLILDVNVTYQDAINAFLDGNYLKGIMYSIHLRKTEILDKFLLSIPKSSINSIASKLSFSVVSSFLDYLCVRLEKDTSFHFILLWILSLLNNYGNQLKLSKNRAVFYNLFKSINKVFKGIEETAEDNIFTIKYLTEFEETKDDSSENTINKNLDINE